jgi:hypothetical protein
MRASALLVATLAISVILSGYAFVLGYKETALSDGLSGTWVVVFALLVAFWARADAAVQKLHRSLDFSIYFLVLWPVALPIYLVKTRGIEGVVYFVGFFALYWAPFLTGLVAYMYLVPT